jgi:hypothetical protein
VYETPGQGALLLPASYINFSTSPTAAPGTSLGANNAILANPAPGSLGDHGLLRACSGPNLHQVDMNFVKKTRITERLAFELRAEMFNIFNHPNFNVPSSLNININNSGFGTLTSTFTSREIQLNARISF